jgi:arabinose-5-phosphate isomerase
MHKGEDVPRVHADTLLRDGLLEMSRKKLGMTVVVDAEDRILGVFTDGDLRRALDKTSVDVRTTLMKDVMTPNPKRIGPRELAAEAVHLMETYSITALPVEANGKLVGALYVHDLFRAGVV